MTSQVLVVVASYVSTISISYLAASCASPSTAGRQAYNAASSQPFDTTSYAWLGDKQSRCQTRDNATACRMARRQDGRGALCAEIITYLLHESALLSARLLQ
jgi:hypothetical protein